MAVIAVAVLWRALVHPAPGTAASDHLASGLVPVAIALALALAYPRLRPLLRGWIAIACGLLALVGGVVAGVRPAVLSSADFAGVLSILAGIAGAALVASGVAVLWTHRRRGGSRRRRWVRRGLIGLAALLGGVFVVMPVALAIVGTNRVRVAPQDLDLGAPAQAVTLTTSDGLTLSGSYVPSRNRAAVLVWPGRRAAVAERARMLVREGYGVLVADPRGDGDSEGTYNAWGWSNEADVDAALAFIARRPDVDPRRIGGLGLSVGGEVLVQTAAGDAALRAVVSEGAGTRSLAEQLDMPDLARWRRPLSPWLVQTAAVAVLSDSSPPESLTDLIARIAPRAVFLIMGDEGNPDEVLNRVYHDAAGEPKELWEIPGAGHVGGLDAAPVEYRRRVVGFFDRELRPR